MPKSKHGKHNKKLEKRARSESDLDKGADQENDSKKLKVEKEQPAGKREAPESAPIATPDATSPSDADSKWENLVYYYLARLKGLCEWRTEAEEQDATTGKAASEFNNLHGDKLEERVLKNVAKERYPHPDKYWAKSKELPNRKSQNEVDTYMCAGYQEGKEQGVKIITRALKYGVMAGILKQDGEKYQVNEKYLKNTPSSASSSESESSIITITSIESRASVNKKDSNGRSGKGSKVDKFQTVPDPSNLQDRQSYDELPPQFNFKNIAGHGRDLSGIWSGQKLDSNLRNAPTSSHRGMLGCNNQKEQRLPKTKAAHSKDMYKNQPGASKDIATVKKSHDERKSSSVKVQKMAPKKIRVTTRNGARSKNISPKEHATYRSKGPSDDYYRRSRSRNQRKKRRRSRSSSDSN